MEASGRILGRSELKELAWTRIDDASLLLRMQRSSAAYYLAGYAVELALKACIAKLIRSDVIPDRAFVQSIYTHKLESLLGTAGLRPRLDAATRSNAQLASNWAIAIRWAEDSRYTSWDPIAAATLIEAIRDERNGVLPWLAQLW